MWYAFLKRLIDLAGALVGLGVTALLYVPIGLAIKLDSPGPVLYSQERVGYRERRFRLYKFRTMQVEVAKDVEVPVAPATRVTRVGRFLRHTSLDELPQFYNVLRGEMSLVGPRPEQVTLACRYADWQRRRYSVLPGMTGWWQVNGRPQPMYDNTALDLYYVDHRSLLLDVLIAFRTPRAMIGRSIQVCLPASVVPHVPKDTEGCLD